MIQRALVLIAGPKDAGKTTFLERLLAADLGLAICVRAERDPGLERERESAPRRHPELARYRAAGGAVAATVYRFPEVDADSFYMSDAMHDYSEAVYIEGDCPLDSVDLRVFVAPSLPAGQSLLRRVKRERPAPLSLLEHIVASGWAGQADRVQAEMAKLGLTQPARRKAPAPCWAVAAGYEGIESAQLVVVNVRSSAERGAAQQLLQDLARLRSDDEVRRDVLGRFGHKIPITAVAANLMDGRDPGLKKALARVRRAVRAVSG